MEALELSQELDNLLLEWSNVKLASQSSQDNSELVPIVPQTVTPDTLVSQGKEQATSKRPKRKHTVK